MFGEPAALTNFSFLEGASHPQEIVAQAKALGHDAVGVADRNSFGRRGAGACGGEGTGCASCPACGSRWWMERIPGLAADRAAYGRLTRLLSEAKMTAPKGECPSRGTRCWARPRARCWRCVAPDAVDAAFAQRLRPMRRR